MSQESAPSCFPFSLAETTSETVATSGLLTRAQQKELFVSEVGFMGSNLWDSWGVSLYFALLAPSRGRPLRRQRSIAALASQSCLLGARGETSVAPDGTEVPFCSEQLVKRFGTGALYLLARGEPFAALRLGWPHHQIPE